MHTRIWTLLICLCLALLPTLQIGPGESYAIGKATPTPDEPLDVETALDEALELLRDQEYDAAIERVDDILEADEAQWEAWYYRGFAHSQQKDWDEAIANYSQALEIRPFNAQIWRLRGDLHRQNRDPRRALADYEQSLFLSPRSTQTYSSLVRLHERDRDKTLRNYYRNLVDATRANAQGFSNRAAVILDEAIESVLRHSRPTQLGYAYFNRASIWSSGEQWESALDDINAALQLQPDMQDYYLMRGFIYAQTERADLAAPDFYRRMTLLEHESIDMNLIVGEPVTVEMDHGLVARLRFEGAAGQVISLGARDILGEGANPLLVLLNPYGEPVAGDDDGGGGLDALIASYELGADGEYTAVVSHANGGFEGRIRVTLR